jgi:hypothetical protein
MLLLDLHYLARLDSMPLDLAVFVDDDGFGASATIAFEQLHLHEEPSKIRTVCKVHLQLLSQAAVVLAV